MPRKKSTSTVEEVRKKKKEAEKRRRDRIKADPVKYQEYKAKEKLRRERRKALKKDVNIEDLSERGKRIRRKEWRERAKKSREQKKQKEFLLRHLQENSPPSSDNDETVADPIPDVVQNNRVDVVSPSILSAESNEQNFNTTPRSRFASPLSVTSTESNQSRQKQAGLKLTKQNRTLRNKIIQNQKIQIQALKKKVHALTVKLQRTKDVNDLKTKSTPTFKQTQYYKKKMDVHRFSEREENSKLCPGKKDTISYRGKTKQKRYLCDTMENLHKKYNSETRNKISYTTFTRHRPFWIVAQKVTERDTCACFFHENFKIAVERLRQLNVIQEKAAQDVCNTVTCSSNNFECMTRQCNNCFNKTLNIIEFDNSEHITYHKWMTIKEARIIKGKEKCLNRTVKTAIESTKKELIEQLYEWLPDYLRHVYTISHQYKALSHIKKVLSPGEAVLHIDFSDNYQCKYASEVQSVHFGASRHQICLHTCVLYHYTDHLGVTPTSFCSVSKCLRHDAAAVYAHLKKSLKELLRDHDINIEILHILSDGPSGQYKNKSMFFLFTQHLVNDLGIKLASWNFSETGHGKGPADGIGATVKRTADALVAQGHDIPDYETFVTKIIVRTNIILISVNETDIEQADVLIPKKMKVIPDTKKIHQITWSNQNPKTIYLRQLTCIQCNLGKICIHYPIRKGFFELPDYAVASHQETNTEESERLDNTTIGDIIPQEIYEGVIEELDDTKLIETFYEITDSDKTTEEDFLKESEKKREENTKYETRRTNDKTTKTNKENDMTKLNKLIKTKVTNVLTSKDDTITIMKKAGSWVVVRFESKKLPVHFIGQIISIEENTYIVKFLKKKNLASGIFVWQEPEDVSLVVDGDIVSILPEPTPTRRGELIFNYDFLNNEQKFK